MSRVSDTIYYTVLPSGSIFLQALVGPSKVPQHTDKSESASRTVAAAYYVPLLTIKTPMQPRQLMGGSQGCKASTLGILGPLDNANIRSVVDGYLGLRSKIFMNQIIIFIRIAKGSPFSICTEGNLPGLISKAKGKDPYKNEQRKETRQALDPEPIL